MKSGLYNVSFCVNLTDCQTEEDAKAAIADMFQRMVDSVDFSEMTLELVEEDDEDLEGEYSLHDDDFSELNFG